MMISCALLASLYVAADAAMKGGPFAHASIRARAAYLVGFSGMGACARIDPQEIAAFDAGTLAGHAVRDRAASHVEA